MLIIMIPDKHFCLVKGLQYLLSLSRIKIMPCESQVFLLSPFHYLEGITESVLCGSTAQHDYNSFLPVAAHEECGQAPSCFVGDARFHPQYVRFLQQLVCISPVNGLAYNFSLLKKLEQTSVRGGSHNFAELFVFQSFLSHDENILAATIVVEHVQSMGVGEPGLVHSQLLALLVHVGNKLKQIKLDALFVLSQVDGSYFYLYNLVATFDQALVAGFVEVDDSAQVLGQNGGCVVSTGEHHPVDQILDAHPTILGQVSGCTIGLRGPLGDLEIGGGPVHLVLVAEFECAETGHYFGYAGHLSLHGRFVPQVDSHLPYYAVPVQYSHAFAVISSNRLANLFSPGRDLAFVSIFGNFSLFLASWLLKLFVCINQQTQFLILYTFNFILIPSIYYRIIFPRPISSLFQPFFTLQILTLSNILALQTILQKMKLKIENKCHPSSPHSAIAKTPKKIKEYPLFRFQTARSHENHKSAGSILKERVTKNGSSKTLLGNLFQLQKRLNMSQEMCREEKRTRNSQRQYLMKSIDRQEKVQESTCEIVVRIGTTVKKYAHRATSSKRLFEFLKQRHSRIESWKSNPQNIALDYYLSFQKNDVQFLNGDSITLQPYTLERKKVITIDSFDILNCIGTGGFSKVFLCRCKEDGKFYAMKVIDKEFILKNKKKKIVMNQKRIMETLKHPFVIQMKFAFQSKSSLIFVLELCPGGELFGLVKKFRIMNESLARFYMIEILLGLEEIHKRGVVYRDFKPENILIDLQGHIRIADFGLAKPGIFSLKQKAYSFCGSPEYMPPEMITKKGHSLPVDFYCLGALLYELVTGLPPFYSENPKDIFEGTISKAISFPSYTEISNQLKSLLRSLLSKDESKRLGTFGGVNEVLYHPWFGQVDKDSYLKKKIEAPVKFTGIKDIKLIFDEMKVKNQNYIFEMLEQQGNAEEKDCSSLSKFYFDFRQAASDLNDVEYLQNAKKQNSFSGLSVKSCRLSSKFARPKEKSLKNILSHRSGTSCNNMRKKPLTARYFDINLYLR